ncbi:hypothetical protein [Massilia sp. CFBP9026]|uniref:hypothetical protein n=1 Tax=Massilia sp. CFBP9026 TaxID=3096536 RepID=UPI002A6AAA00|nr:hypothetical protein [Massilia sp. CFBP9026]MDY0961748.1 hypothetical protein [Massilia sp. CFBP9026]
MKLKAILPFDWAHGGVKVEHFPIGAEIETEDEDLITVSTREGWAVEAGAVSQAASKADQADETLPAPVPDAEDPSATDTPAAPKRGRAKQ